MNISVSNQISDTRQWQMRVPLVSAFLLLAILQFVPAVYANGQQFPIYLNVSVDPRFGVNDRQQIEKILAQAIAERFGAHERSVYRFWLFVPRYQAISAETPIPMPYIDLMFKYDPFETVAQFVVRLHVNESDTLPDDADRDKWQVNIATKEVIAQTGFPKDSDGWIKLANDAIDELKEKSQGKIRQEMENQIPLGRAKLELRDDKVVANLESGDSQVSAVVNWDFRVCCVLDSNLLPALVFAGKSLNEGFDPSVVRIRSEYKRSCAKPCTERCETSTDDQRQLDVGLEPCFFWLDNRPQSIEWLVP
jgi:hypothetical protein